MVDATNAADVKPDARVKSKHGGIILARQKGASATGFNLIELFSMRPALSSWLLLHCLDKDVERLKTSRMAGFAVCAELTVFKHW